MVRFAARLYLLSISLAIIILGVNAGAQGKPEKEKIRIGYAARAVTHSIPYLANEAGLFRDEGLQVEIVRTAGAVSPMALISGDTDFATMSAFLAYSGVGPQPRSCHARRVDALRRHDPGGPSGNPYCEGFDGRGYWSAASGGRL